MGIDIEYGEDIIVGVIFNNEWKWFVTEKDVWYLDLPKLETAFLEKGHRVHNLGDYSERFNIAVLDETTVPVFLKAAKQFEVTTTDLKQTIYEEQQEIMNNKYYIMKFVPSLLVDFDSKMLLSFFSESASFEQYVPDGWVGKYEEFLDRVPIEQKYWIVDEIDYINQ